MTVPSLVLCSGSLGTAPLDEKFRAAASVGFDFVSVYGHEYRAAVDAGVDGAALLRDLDLRVAEVDGVAISLVSDAPIAEAVVIAQALSARSITVVETQAYDPADPAQVESASEVFAGLCDAVANDGIVVHIEPFAWSSLSRVADALAIVECAGRPNGGVLLDLWHNARSPDRGHLSPDLGPANLFGIQLADTLAEPWPNIRDECMSQRLLPGDGHAALAQQVAELASRGPLPPIGIEVFGAALADRSPATAAAEAHASATRVLAAAGVEQHERSMGVMP